MGKKKAKPAGTPADAEKELGNKAFSDGRYTEALEHYSKAIEMSTESPNHVYYSNRAQVYIVLTKYQNAIEDCDKSLQIDANFIKSFYRKTTA